MVSVRAQLRGIAWLCVGSVLGCGLPPAPGSLFVADVVDVADAPVPECTAGQTRCAGACVDLQTAASHCGACGRACAAGEACAAGVCTLNCPTGQTNCSGTCRDLGNTNTHCGACDNACPAGQVCMSGACRVSCAAGSTNCSGSCRDLASDAANCGACGRACSMGQVCSKGACTCNNPALTFCSAISRCVDLQTDPNNCGRCGNPCPAGQPCAAGMCPRSLAQRSCPVASAPGCGMVPVPGGTFTMGAPSECSGTPDATCAYHASPAQPYITVSAFAIDAYEVTVARFRTWVTAGQPTPTGAPPRVDYRGVPMDFEGSINTSSDLNTYSECNWNVAGRDNHPINCVNWATAQAFCVWDGGRLPTQAEWEFAARGPSATPRLYPWGSAAPDNSLTCWSGSGMSRSSTCPVGMFPAGAVNGIHDLAGNVWEWNADWAASYASGGMGCWNGTTQINRICNDRGDGVRMIRGGSWIDSVAVNLRSASRFFGMPASRSGPLGFRCARD